MNSTPSHINHNEHTAADAEPEAEHTAPTVYVVRDQRGCYWGKGREWVDGRDPRHVARFKHHDEAVNTLFELSSKDVDLRGSVLSAELNARGEPALAPGCLYPDATAAQDAPAHEAAEPQGPDGAQAPGEQA